MDLDAPVNEELAILFETRLPEASLPEPIDYCNGHDLIALVLARTQDVAVFRINGQLVFRVERRDADSVVTALKWKPDGTLLGVGWSDGTVGLYAREDGKLMNQSSVRRTEAKDDWKLDLTPDDDVLDDSEEAYPAVCLGWSTPLSHADPSLARVSATEAATTLEEWLDDEDSVRGKTNIRNGGQALSQLAKSIATLDITTVLPRLSALPVHALRFGPGEQKFTTQAGVDILLDASQTLANNVTTFFTSSNSGEANVYIRDSVSLGHLDIGSLGSRSILVSDPDCSSQVILSSLDDYQQLRLNYLDLLKDKLNSPLLHVVTTNTKRIQSLLAYVTQTVRCMQSDCTSNLRFPSRILENMSEELGVESPKDVVTNLCHLAMTGTFSNDMVNCLKDIVGDNNHKRWDKHVNDMYNHIQNHIFVNLVPALDRLAIATNTILGHATARSHTDDFVSVEPFTILLDDLDALRLAAQKLQLIVMTEHRQFRAFSKWLRVMVDIAIAGPNTKGAVETEEREAPNMDYTLLLEYIEHTLMQSSISAYLEQPPEMKGTCTSTEFWKLDSIARATHDNVVAAIRKDDHAGEQYRVINGLSSVLNLPALAIRIAGRGRLAIASITKWQSEMLTKPEVMPIDPSHLAQDSRVLDVALFPHANDVREKASSSIVSILSTTQSSNSNHHLSLLYITRTRSTAQPPRITTQQHTISLPDGEIIQAAIMKRERQCITLMKDTSEHARYMLLTYPLPHSSVSGSETQEPSAPHILHTFAADTAFEPSHFIVGGRPGKMVCVVSAKDGREWQVLDLARSFGRKNGTSAGSIMGDEDEDTAMLLS